jgi:hypothetical protein
MGGIAEPKAVWGGWECVPAARARYEDGSRFHLTLLHVERETGLC